MLEPTKPKQPCRYPGCSLLTDGIYCEEHEKIMKQHYEHFQRGYSLGKRYGRAWKRIRDRYMRSHPYCELCFREGRIVPAGDVHHSVPLSKEGMNDESNPMSLAGAVTRRFIMKWATDDHSENYICLLIIGERLLGCV